MDPSVDSVKVENRTSHIGLNTMNTLSRNASERSLRNSVMGENSKEEEWTLQRVLRVFLIFSMFLVALWVFLVGLKIMGDAFKTLGGCEAGTLFDFVDNPIAGLMIGVLSTVLVQSSSTSTSVVVSMVGSGILSVTQAVPVIMGANIGTTVTSTIVAVGQIHDKVQFERAFSAATVHDMFNILSVIVLLPIEVIFHPLRELSLALVSDGTASDGEEWNTPLDKIVKPVSGLFLKVNKKIITKAAEKKISCKDVTTILKGGMFHGHTSDNVAGAICLVISLILTIAALLAIVKLLNLLLLSTVEKQIKKALRMNGYIMMVIGAGVTFVVQSSSITTSVLTPLVGIDLIGLEQMYPMVLGANIGTTGTAFLASLVSAKDEAVQIAICHLFFNIFGIILWYPIPFMRRVPMKLARGMGYIASELKWFPLLYIAALFVAIPGALLGISLLYEGSTGLVLLGALLTVLIIIMLSGALYFWYRCDGKARVILWIETHGSSDPKEFHNVDLEGDIVASTPKDSTYLKHTA